MSADLFKDIIPSILRTKDKDVITENNEQDYVPFVVNKALSYHYDCILWANQMNIYPGLDKIMQFHFLLNTVKGYKRPFSKWLKKEKGEYVDSVMEYYGYSREKAMSALEVLSTENLQSIEKELDKGGSNAKSRNRIDRGDTTNSR